MDLDILCPMCQDSVMCERDGMRVCDECGHEISIIEYQILLANRFAQINDAFMLPSRIERRNFGKKQKH